MSYPPPPIPFVSTCTTLLAAPGADSAASARTTSSTDGATLEAGRYKKGEDSNSRSPNEQQKILLYKLAQRNASRPRRGSVQYRKSWRTFSGMALNAIREELSQVLPTPVNADGFQSLWYSLGIAADVGRKPNHHHHHQQQDNNDDDDDNANDQRTPNHDDANITTTFGSTSQSAVDIDPMDRTTTTTTTATGDNLFSDAGSRSGYALDFLCRAQLLADLLINWDENPTMPLDFRNHVKTTLIFPTITTRGTVRYRSHSSITTTNTNSFGGKCNLMSLGGGPGFDFTAAAIVALHNSGGDESQIHVQATIFDYEEGWHDLVQSMTVATQKALLFDNHADTGNDEQVEASPSMNDDVTTADLSCAATAVPNGTSYTVPSPQEEEEKKTKKKTPILSCSWGGKCDITKSLSDPVNALCAAAIPTTNLFTCQYCVAENAKALQQSDFIFFRDLMDAAPLGSVFVFTETTPRLWPDFYDFLSRYRQEYSENHNNDDVSPPFLVEIGFPQNVQTKRKARQMVFCKLQPPVSPTPAPTVLSSTTVIAATNPQCLEEDHERDDRQEAISDLEQLVEEFRQYSVCQDRKVEEGRGRQPKRVAGKIFSQK
jgi:hypothetical protein